MYAQISHSRSNYSNIRKIMINPAFSSIIIWIYVDHIQIIETTWKEKYRRMDISINRKGNEKLTKKK